MPSRANYAVVDDSDDILVIKDIGPWSNYPTVTNDAEAVVEELSPRLNGRRLYYFDSDKEIGELFIKDGIFNGYSFGGPPIK